MTLVRRLRTVSISLVLPLMLVAAASAAPPAARHASTHRAHHTARLSTATYRVLARPHAPARLHASRSLGREFAPANQRLRFIVG